MFKVNAPDIEIRADKVSEALSRVAQMTFEDGGQLSVLECAFVVAALRELVEQKGPGMFKVAVQNFKNGNVQLEAPK